MQETEKVMVATEEINRRQFLSRTVPLAALGFLGSAFWTSLACKENKQDLGQEGHLLGLVPFIGEGDNPLDTVVGTGLDGRKFTDLSAMTSSQKSQINENFYLRTLAPKELNPDDWKIQILGIESSQEWSMQELLSRTSRRGIHLMECAGNDKYSHFGLISAAEWKGMPIVDLLEQMKIPPKNAWIKIAGLDHSQASPGSTPGASWIFTSEDLVSAGAFLATEMNSRPLSKDHGAPVRLMVPGWYGCACIKWVNEITVVPASAPATGQMLEFATRTHQFGIPRLASEYQPATVDLAAMPVQVEKWQVDGKIVYKIIGVLWGGNKEASTLFIRFHRDSAYVPVSDFKHETNRGWTVWTHIWRPETAGKYKLRLQVQDRTIQTRRLDVGYYTRTVEIVEV